MGLSISASVAVLFTAVILSSIVLYETVENSMDEMQDAERFEMTAYQQQLHSEVVIVSLEQITDESILVTVKNTGDSQLVVKQEGMARFEVLINGYLLTHHVPGDTIRIENSRTTDILNPTEEMSFVVEEHSPRSGDELKIVFYEKCVDYAVFE